MFKTFFQVLALSILGFVSHPSPTSFAQDQAPNSARFGRYLGVLKHAQIEQDQLVKLDFIVSRQTGSELQLIAILNVYFGDYNSSEYISYHFDKVTYNILTGTMVFDQPDQEITVVTDRFAGGSFEGHLRSTSSGSIGTLVMQQEGIAKPERPLVQNLWGEYQAFCDGKQRIIQIQTHRSSNDSSRMGNPFGSYEVSAQIAENDPKSCLNSKFCVVSTYTAGSYNYFQGNLDLSGSFDHQNCHVATDGLTCGSCNFARISKDGAKSSEYTYPIHAKPTTTDGAIDDDESDPAAETPAAQLGGHYYGYVFHERLGIYQAVSLNLVTYQKSADDGRPALYVSGVSSMYFGGFQSLEAVTTRFNEREFPLLSPQIVLENIAGDADAIVQITQLGNGKAKGVWNSLLFGRVGTFELVQGKMPEPPLGTTVMPSIGGLYMNNDWSLDLRVVRESSPISTVNPFFPLNFKGAFRLINISANMKISDGSYDFYTGKVTFFLDDDSLFSGYRSGTAELHLKRPTPGSFRPLLPHAPYVFKKVSPSK